MKGGKTDWPKATQGTSCVNRDLNVDLNRELNVKVWLEL